MLLNFGALFVTLFLLRAELQLKGALLLLHTQQQHLFLGHNPLQGPHPPLLVLQLSLQVLRSKKTFAIKAKGKETNETYWLSLSTAEHIAEIMSPCWHIFYECHRAYRM